MTQRVSPVENVGYLIDRSSLDHPKDWLVHDTGSFRYGSRSIALIENGKMKALQKEPETVPVGAYLVFSISWKHSNSEDFKRQSTTVRTSDGEMNIALLEYRFTGPPHPVSPKINSRGKALIPILPSVKQATIKRTTQEHPEMGSRSAMVTVEGNLTTNLMDKLPRNMNQVWVMIKYLVTRRVYSGWGIIVTILVSPFVRMYFSKK